LDTRRGSFVALACAVALALATSSSAGEVIERVLAVVGSDVITLGDVTAARDLRLVAVQPSPDPIGDTLGRLVDRSLMLAEVDRYLPPEPTQEAIDRELTAVRARFPTEAAFDAVIAKVGLDERYLREILRQDLRIRAYVEQRFTIPPPADEEVEAYYREHAPIFAGAGAVPPLDAVRERVVQAIVEERRKELVDTWVAGLRRRADITNLYLTSK